MSQRIELIRIRLTTGTAGHAGPVSIRCNGASHPLNRISGGTNPGESYEGEFFIGSPTTECRLLGPTEGQWDVKEMTVEYDQDGGVVMRHFGPVGLDADTSLDLLAEQG